MRRRSLLFVIVFVLAVAGIYERTIISRLSTARGRLERQLALSAEENERLRKLVSAQEKARTVAQTQADRAKIEKEVEALRGLKFTKPVDYNTVSRKDIRKVFSAALAEEMSDQEYEDVGRAWARLGLFPKPIPLRDTLLDLLGEQVAAFYNHREHKLYMFEDSSLEKAQDRMILAHELVHALQDQHYNLLSLPISLKTNDDQALAALSIIEGDATLVMTQYMAGNLSMKAVLESASSVFTTQMDQLKKAPRFLRDRLVFPYLHGRDFCAAAMAFDGQAGMEECYTRLPASTTQILHPEKWESRPPEQPVTIQWRELTLRGEAPTVDNVMGESAVRALFSEWLDDTIAKDVSTGWRGDRYLSYKTEDALIWQSSWASAEAAEKFYRAQADTLAKRYGAALSPRTDGALIAEQPRVIRLLKAKENSVVFIDAASAPTAAALEEQFFPK